MKKFIPSVILFLLLSIFFSCNYKYYVNHNFRKDYTDLNQVLHQDSSAIPFFKIHLKDGNVSVLENWGVNESEDKVFGQGKLFDFNRNQIKEGNLSFNIDDISIIETNELEIIKSKDKKRLAALSILTGLNVVGDAVCLANPKACFGSCPTFYIDGETYLHSASAEGFSSAISPSLEKNDIDALRYSTSNQSFYVTMKNEAYETHMINELAVHAIPKNKNETVYNDMEGNYYACGILYDCKYVVTENKEITDAVNQMDDNEYFSMTDSFDLTTRENIIVEYDRLPDADLGLVINFRQTMLTTFILYSGLSYMGDEVGSHFTKIETNKRIKKRLKNPFKRLGGIKLSVWDEQYKRWKIFDELFETGPIAKNLMIAPIPKIKPKSGKLKIKIELTKGFWRLDYLGITPIHSKVNPLIVHPTNVEMIDGKNNSIDDVKFDDENYFISFPGNEFNFNFKFPQIKKGKEYELFLATKGYYLEWMRQSWMEEKDPIKLKKMFTHDPQTWRDLAIEFKTMEYEMETVFWNSKYSPIQ